MFLIILTASLPLLMNMEETASQKRLVLEEMDFEQELLLLKAAVLSMQNNLTALGKENANLQRQLTALSPSKARGKR